jgi:hypothetical protein
MPISPLAVTYSRPRLSRPELLTSAREKRGSTRTSRTCSNPVTSQAVWLPGKTVRSTEACRLSASNSGAGSNGTGDVGSGNPTTGAGMLGMGLASPSLSPGLA